MNIKTLLFATAFLASGNTAQSAELNSENVLGIVSDYTQFEAYQDQLKDLVYQHFTNPEINHIDLEAIGNRIDESCRYQTFGGKRTMVQNYASPLKSIGRMERELNDVFYARGEYSHPGQYKRFLDNFFDNLETFLDKERATEISTQQNFQTYLFLSQADGNKNLWLKSQIEKLSLGAKAYEVDIFLASLKVFQDDYLSISCHFSCILEKEIIDESMTQSLYERLLEKIGGDFEPMVSNGYFASFIRSLQHAR